MKLLSVVITSLAFGLAAADYNTVLADITTINTGTTKLDNDVKKVVAGIAGLPFALQVQQDAVALDKLVIKGTSDAQASAPFGANGSLQVSGALINTSNTVVTALNDIASRRANFGDFSPVVLNSLYQLKQDTDAFAAAVIKKLDAFEAALAPVIVANIDNAFNNAIRAYGGQTT